MKIRSLVTILVILILLMTAAGCGRPEAKKMKFYHKGRVLYEKSEYAKARLEFKNALQIDPRFADAYFMLGQTALRQGDLRNAYAYLSRTVDLAPGNIEAQLLLGKILLTAGIPGKALEKANTVLARDSLNTEAHLLKAGALIADRKEDQARLILVGLIKRGVRKPDLYLMMARIFQTKNEGARVEQILKEGEEANPESVPLLLSLAHLYAGTGRIGETEKTLKRIVTLQPRNTAHRLNLASLYWDTNRKEEAVQELGWITRSAPSDEGAWMSVAKFYLSKRKADDGEKTLKAGVSKNPRSMNLRFALSELYMGTGRTEGAISILKESLSIPKDERSPDIARIKNALALCHLLRGETDQAQIYVNDALRVFPKNQDLHFTKGKIYLKNGDSSNAVSEFRSLVGENPQFIPGYLALADAHILNRDLDLAVKVLREPLKDAPDSMDLLLALARVYVMKKDPDSARSTLRKALEYHPDHYQIHADIGDLFLAQKDFRKAEQEYRAILLKHPDREIGYVKLARSSMTQGKPGQGIFVLEEGYRNIPQSWQLFDLLVRAYLAKPDYTKAVLLCRDRILKNPRDAFAYNILGKLYGSRKEYTKAQSAFEHAIRIQQVWPEPYGNLARMYMAQGKRDDAIRRFERAISENPKVAAPYLSLGMIYELSDDYAGSSRTYAKALAEIPDLWPAANNLAFILSNHPSAKADIERALALARRAQSIAPNEPAVIDTLGWVYFRMGDMRQASAYIGSALDRAPQNPTYNYHMGMVHYRSGRIGDAREKLAASVRGNEKFEGRDEAERTLLALRK